MLLFHHLYHARGDGFGGRNEVGFGYFLRAHGVFAGIEAHALIFELLDVFAERRLRRHQKRQAFAMANDLNFRLWRGRQGMTDISNSGALGRSIARIELHDDFIRRVVDGLFLGLRPECDHAAQQEE